MLTDDQNRILLATCEIKLSELNKACNGGCSNGSGCENYQICRDLTEELHVLLYELQDFKSFVNSIPGGYIVDEKKKIFGIREDA